MSFADSHDDAETDDQPEPLYKTFITPTLKFDSLHTMPGLIDRLMY